MRHTSRIAASLAVLLFASLAGAQYKQQVPSSKPAASPLIVPNAQSATTGKNFPRITIADAAKLHREGKAVFIDVRSNEQFTYGHIKGALTIPGSQVVKRFAEVPMQKVVITYCACDAEQSSGRAVNELLSHGVRNVFALKGGWHEWKKEGLPIAAGPK
jgi:rhodanese-related sulfurtransferase